MSRDAARAQDPSGRSAELKDKSAQAQAAQDRWKHAEEENRRLRAQIEEVLSRQDDLLRQSGSQQAYFQAVLGQLPAGVVVAEAPSGRVLFRNPQVEQIFRRQLADVGNVLQPHGAAGCHRDGRPYRPEEWPVVRAIRQGEIVKDEHIGMVRGDGSCAVISISASPIRDAEGKITAVVAVDHDVTDLYLAREEIRQIHEGLVGIFERIQDVVVAVDREQRLTYMNRYMAKLAGVNPEEVIGLNVWERFPELLGTEVEANCRRAMAEQVPVRFEMRGVFTGRYYDVIAFPTQEGLTFHGRDIMDRKQAEAEREHLLAEQARQREFLQNLINNSPVGIAVFQGPELRFVLANPAYQAFWPGRSLIGRTLAEVLPEVVGSFTPEQLQAVLRTGRPDRFREYPIPNLGGREQTWWNVDRIPLRNEQGQYDLVLTMVQDVTDHVLARRQVEQAGAEAAMNLSKLETVISNIDQGIVIADPQGNILTVNPAAVAMGGLDSAQKGPMSLSHYAEVYEVTDADGRVLAMADWPMARALRGERFSDHELRVRRRDTGRTWVISFGGTPVANNQGEVILGVLTLHDITARKQAEAQLKELNETLERRVAERTAVAEQRAAQLQKLAGELTRVEEHERRRLAEVLHDDLQQLLVGAKFSTSMAKARIDDQAVREALHRVDELLDESIQASRSLTTELSPPIVYQADLPGVLRWLARWMYGKHGLEVEVRVDEETDPQAEETRIVLFHAVRELLLNVAKYARVNQATVRLEGSEDNYVRVSVQDKGVGFDPGQMDMQQQASGGFGLFSIQERLIMLGGRMEIQSAPGAGTKVTLWAPLRRGPLQEEGSGSSAALAPFVEGKDLEEAPADRSAALRVMLADDHEVVRNGLARLLQTQSGIEVIGQASDGQMAVDLARQIRPDVVVMDVSMPRLDGVEATRRIKRESPHVRVVGLSMHAEADMAERMVQAGATAYLAKSSAPDELVAAIQLAGRGTADRVTQ